MDWFSSPSTHVIVVLPSNFFLNISCHCIFYANLLDTLCRPSNEFHKPLIAFLYYQHGFINCSLKPFDRSLSEPLTTLTVLRQSFHTTNACSSIGQFNNLVDKCWINVDKCLVMSYVNASNGVPLNPSIGYSDTSMS